MEQLVVTVPTWLVIGFVLGVVAAVVLLVLVRRMLGTPVQPIYTNVEHAAPHDAGCSIVIGVVLVGLGMLILVRSALM